MDFLLELIIPLLELIIPLLELLCLPLDARPTNGRERRSARK